MKKRCIAAMLVLVLVAGLLAGCSNPSVQEPASQAASSGDTAPSIYAQHGKCRNHAAFHYLKDN